MSELDKQDGSSGDKRRGYRSTSPEGLEFDSMPMQLWSKAKQLGTWDPADIDFSQDRRDWSRLTDEQQRALLHLCSIFLGGEESVARDLLPLVQVMADEGRLEEEMYLTSFLFEEAKHVEVFRRFFDDVAQTDRDLTEFHGDNYTRIFDEALPEALNRLRDEPSPVNQADASTTYNMIVEGVLAETGYHAFREVLVEREMMPGMQEVTRLLKQDESRHMAYGVYLLSRLVDEHGEPVWQRIDKRMQSLLPAALGMIQEYFDDYDTMPFDLEVDQFTEFATDQYQKRLRRIQPAD
jgi:ribonucleoside-diphosphate reductase beta chain